jgi:hypothetical protein
MSDTNISDFIRARLAEAKDKDISTPVILTLSERSEHALAIYEDLHGHPMAPSGTDGDHEFGRWEVLSPAEASRLLRDHGDQGGAHAADLLSDPARGDAAPMDFWFVGLLQERIHIRAFLNGVEVWHWVTRYDRVPRNLQTPSQLAQDLGPSLWMVSVDGGKAVPVCGPNGKDVILASALAGVAADRVIDTQYQGKPVQIKVDDDRLASLLLDVYGGKPHVIAEAIMALKKGGGGKEGWLVTVLRGRPELQDLAKRVEHELTGK